MRYFGLKIFAWALGAISPMTAHTAYTGGPGYLFGACTLVEGQDYPSHLIVEKCTEQCQQEYGAAYPDPNVAIGSAAWTKTRVTVGSCDNFLTYGITIKDYQPGRRFCCMTGDAVNLYSGPNHGCQCPGNKITVQTRSYENSSGETVNVDWEPIQFSTEENQYINGQVLDIYKFVCRTDYYCFCPPNKYGTRKLLNDSIADCTDCPYMDESVHGYQNSKVQGATYNMGSLALGDSNTRNARVPSVIPESTSVSQCYIMPSLNQGDMGKKYDDHGEWNYVSNCSY